MISLLFSNVVGLVMPNKWLWVLVVGLLATTSATAYMLKQSYISNGEQSALTEQWLAASEHYQTAYIDLDKDLLIREKERNRAWVEMGKLKDKLRKLRDENGCLDSDVPDNLRLLFIRAETNS